MERPRRRQRRHDQTTTLAVDLSSLFHHFHFLCPWSWGWWHNPLLIMVVATSELLLGSCQAQSDFYDVQSNSYFWNNLGAVAGNSYGSASDPNNPFTPQDFGGSSSDGFNPIDRQQQQQQLSFQANGGPSFLPRPASSSPLDFHAYGGTSGGGTYSNADEMAVDDDGQQQEPTKFPTLIPEQKLAEAAGFTEPIEMDDVTEPTQPNWASEVAEIKDVSLMRSVPAPVPRGQQMPQGQAYGGFPLQQFANGWMGGQPNFGGASSNNGCFGTGSTAGCPIPLGGGGGTDEEAGGGDSFVSGDGAYQFPMPDEMMTAGMAGQGGAGGGGGGTGMPFQGQGFFGQQQQMAGAGMFPGPFSPQQQQNGAFNGDGRLMGSPTGFGGLNTGEPDDGEEDEQEEFSGGGVGSFVESGPSLNMMGGMPQQPGGGGVDEQRRYQNYLEMINRKYGIGMPGNPGMGQMTGNGQPSNSAGNLQPQTGIANTGFVPVSPSWGIPPGGRPPNGQLPMTMVGQQSGGNDQLAGQNLAQALALSQQQRMCQQQMLLNSLSNNKVPQNAGSFVECAGANGWKAMAGGGGSRTTAGTTMPIHGQHGGASIPNSGGDHRSQQPNNANSIAGTVLGSGDGQQVIGGGHEHSSGTGSRPSSAGPTEELRNGGGQPPEATKPQNRASGTGHYGSAFLGRLIGDSLGQSMRQQQQSGLIAAPHVSSSPNYVLSGSNVPYPFGTARQGQQNEERAQNNWPPNISSPTVHSGSFGSKAPSAAASKVPSAEQSQQKQRSIEAIQQQLLLALLSSTPPPIRVTETTTMTAMASSSQPPAETTSTAAAEQQQRGPLQQSTSSVQALTQQIRRLPAVLYADSRLPSSRKLEALLREVYGLPLVTFYVDRIERPAEVERNLEQLTAHRGLPFLFICGTFIGTTEHVKNYHEQRQMPKLVEFVCNGNSSTTKKTKKRARRPSPSTEASSPPPLMDESLPATVANHWESDRRKGSASEKRQSGKRNLEASRSIERPNGRRRQPQKKERGNPTAAAAKRIFRDEHPKQALNKKLSKGGKENHEGRRRLNANRRRVAKGRRA